MTEEDINKILVDEEKLRLEINTMSSSSLHLDREALVDRYVEVECAKKLNACKTEEERAKRKAFYKEYYLTGPGRNFISASELLVTGSLKTIDESVNNLKEVCQGVVAENALPSVITTGAATSVPNPAWNLLSNKQKVSLCLNFIDVANNALIELYNAALLLHLPLPEEVTITASSLAAVKTIINAIPI